MNRFKVEGYVKEFPFLKEISKKIKGEEYTDIDFIKIARIDENLLNKVPYYSGATGSCVGIDEGEGIYFVLSDGKIISNAVKQSGDITHNEAHADNEYWEGETILEAIYRHNITDNLKYIIVKHYGYIIRNHYTEGGLSFIIYKIGKNEMIQDFINTIKEKEFAKIQAEANF